MKALQDDIQTSHAPEELIVAHSLTPRSPNPPVLMRKRDDSATGSTKWSRNDQRELSTSNESDRQGRGNLTEEVFPQRCHGTEVSLGARLLVSNGSSSRSGLVKESTNGAFSDWRDFVMHEPLIVDSSQHYHVQEDQLDKPLLWLQNSIMKGAEFDSSERDPPPQCHPNTRVPIVERINNWIWNRHREKKMLWVRGAAGVGKSAIVQTVFDRLPDKLRGGSVFFRANEQNDPNKVFPTIAYCLAVWDLSYRAYIKELMLKDPRPLTEKSIKRQFGLLFEEPFAERKLRDGQDALVIALDGLERCGSESAQEQIVKCISDFILQNPSAPFVWIISSRPEIHLLATFTGKEVGATFWEEEIPVDSVLACEDVERYLSSEFTRIREKHHNLIKTIPWPNNKELALVATKASGLFIFAQVVIRFIDDSNPIEKLKYALAATSNASWIEATQNPLAKLDDMYEEIVSKLPPERLEPAKKIIATIAEFDHKCVSESVGTLPLICNILDIPRDIALTALYPLRSVLYFPEEIESSRPRFYHVSFRDFLENKFRSHKYSIKEIKVGDELVVGLMRFTGRVSLDDNSLPWPGNGDSQLIVNMVQKKYDLRDLLSFRACFFSSEFTVSESVLSQFLRTRDFAVDHNHVLLMVLMKEEMVQTHERLGVARRKAIRSLGITRDTISNCKISKERLRCYVVSLNEFRSPSEGEEVKSVRNILCRWIEVEAERLVTVWGHEQFRRSAVFRLSHDPAVIRLFGRSFCYRRHLLDLEPDIAVIGF